MIPSPRALTAAGTLRARGEALFNATWLGGADADRVTDVAVGPDGSVFAVGYTGSDQNIATPGAFQPLRDGAEWDAFLVRYDSSGRRVWGTYFGGDHLDVAYGVAVTPSGDVVVVGGTESTYGITTGVGQQPRLAGWMDAFVACFSPEGTLRWSTYYGGSEFDVGNAVAVGADGSIALAGSTNSPSGIATPGAHQSTYGGGTNLTRGDAFLALFTATGALQWSTYLGGSENELARGADVDATGRILLCGYTWSRAAIATPGSWQGAYGGKSDGFAAVFSASGQREWGSYIGGPADDGAEGACFDRLGRPVVVGWTQSSVQIASPDAHQPVFAGAQDGFIFAFAADGAQRWSTYYGGRGDDWCFGASVDAAGRPLVVGASTSDEGIVPDGGGSRHGGMDGCAVLLSEAGARLDAAWLGGEDGDQAVSCAVAPNGLCIIGGWTTSTTGIAGSGAQQPFHGGGASDGVVMSWPSHAPTGLGDMAAPAVSPVVGIFPQPCIGEATICVHTASDRHASVVLWSMSGRSLGVLWEGRPTAGVVMFHVGVAAMPAGPCLLEFRQDGCSVVRPLVLLR